MYKKNKRWQGCLALQEELDLYQAIAKQVALLKPIIAPLFEALRNIEKEKQQAQNELCKTLKISL